MNHKSLILLALLVMIAVAGAGCLGSQAPGSDKAMLETRANAGQSGPIPSPGPSGIASDGSGSVSATTGAKIIKTAYLTIEVPDVTGSVESLTTLATRRNGYVSSTNVQSSYNNRLSGTVVLRIPGQEFDGALAEVKSVGQVKSISTQGRDITEEYVDLQAQKTSFLNQLAQYNTIMKKAEKVEDVIAVQQQIDRVQTELNRLEGRLKYLDSQVDLSTITVSLQEPEPVGSGSSHTFISTLNEGIAGFFGMVDAIIIFFLTVLPLIIAGCIIYGIYRWNKGRKPGTMQVTVPK